MLWPLLISAALARPEAPSLFCDSYPEAPACAGGAVSCVVCHDAGGPPGHNPYGADISDVRAEGAFADTLADALAEVASLDSDGDGASNAAEILAGTWPGSADDVEPECLPQVQTGNDFYAVGTYDPRFAFGRVTLDFCGRSPRFEEWAAFDDAVDGLSAAEAQALVDDQLRACLGAPYWDQATEEIAVGVVRPAGVASDLNILGNYQWDLRLFRYATSGDRDAADLLQAQYFVIEEVPGSGVLSRIEEPRNDTEDYAQPLAAEDRYGMITTRYSLAMNVMFAPMPRTLTAHVYRELLGLDIALSEGLFPIDEADGDYPWDAPLDVDEKGVWQEECAGCHTTIDPLSYPWARYNGIDLEGDTTGAYLPDRATEMLPEIDGYIFGEPVDGPEQWVAAAIASDAFAERMVELFWTYIFRRTPYSCESEEYAALWQNFRDDGRNVEAMLAELVRTDAYGTP